VQTHNSEIETPSVNINSSRLTNSPRRQPQSIDSSIILDPSILEKSKDNFNNFKVRIHQGKKKGKRDPSSKKIENRVLIKQNVLDSSKSKETRLNQEDDFGNMPTRIVESKEDVRIPEVKSSSPASKEDIRSGIDQNERSLDNKQDFKETLRKT